MNLIIQWIIIAYLFLIVPFHMGILEAVFFSKSRRKISEIFTNGYLLMFACFWIISVAAVQLNWSLSKLTMGWTGFLIIVSVAANLFGRKQMKVFICDILEFWGFKRPKTKQIKGRYKLLFGLIFLIAGSICFTRPDSEDLTWEIVHTAVETDTLYAYDEYTGERLEAVPLKHAYAPIEMLYAASVHLTGISDTVLLYYQMPVYLICFFYMALWKLGTQFFAKTDHIESFMWIAAGLYLMTTYLEGQSVVTGIFLNSWNGLTLLSCCVMPAILSCCIAWIKGVFEKQKNMPDKLEVIYRMVILVLAGQLTNEKGSFYIILMFGIMLAVIIAGKGYRYGVTTGRFKKCV